MCELGGQALRETAKGHLDSSLKYLACVDWKDRLLREHHHFIYYLKQINKLMTQVRCYKDISQSVITSISVIHGSSSKTCSNYFIKDKATAVNPKLTLIQHSVSGPWCSSDELFNQNETAYYDWSRITAENMPKLFVSVQVQIRITRYLVHTPAIFSFVK